jgi:hypothetical protein
MIKWNMSSFFLPTFMYFTPVFMHSSYEGASLVGGFPPPLPGFEPRSGHVGFVVDKVALWHVFSEYFGFHLLLHIRNRLSSGAGTIGQIVADVPSGLGLTPTPRKPRFPTLEAIYSAYRITTENKSSCEESKYMYLSCYGVRNDGPWRYIAAVMQTAVIPGAKEMVR